MKTILTKDLLFFGKFNYWKINVFLIIIFKTFNGSIWVIDSENNFSFWGCD